MVQPIRAAQYVRMSTEHQRYSIEAQQNANAQHARGRGWEIVTTYADAGRSGLCLKNRAGLKQLLADVMSGQADFSVIIVYDVSRWGRFQDPDEGAHYEFVCRAAGVRVDYSGESFANDQSLTSAILKTVKRAMAAEYVRELSTKVRVAKHGLGAQGYFTGGPAPYGFRRAMVAPDGSLREILERGQRKALQGHRVVLIEGSAEEVATVRRIFNLFVVHGLRFLSIADILNEEGVSAGYGAAWTALRVRRVLTNEKYVGTLVLGRYATFLNRQVVLPPNRWRRVHGACPALVDPAVFAAAQANLQRHLLKATDEQLLSELRAALARHGKLSENILKFDPQARSGRIYDRRFGSLTRAFELIGYERTPEQQRMLDRLLRTKPHRFRTWGRAYTAEYMLERLKTVFEARGRLSADLIDGTPEVPHSGAYRAYFGSLGRAYELVGYQPNAHQRRKFKPWPAL